MKEKINEFLKETEGMDDRAKILFFLCFNLLEDDCKLSSGELRRIVYDTLDALGIEE